MPKSSSKGKELKFGERVTRDHLEKDENEDEFWKKSELFFEKEKKCIEDEITRRIESEKEKNKEALWRKIEDEIKKIYVCKVDPKLLEKLIDYIFFVDPVLLNDIENKRFHDEVKKNRKFVWNHLFIINFIWILLVFALIFIYKYGIGLHLLIVFLYSFLLVLGGSFLGRVLGDYLYKTIIKGEAKNRIEEILMFPKALIKIISGEIGDAFEETNQAFHGLMLILLVAYWWSLGTNDMKDKVFIFLMIIGLGLIVIILEAIKTRSNKILEYCIQQQEKGLQVMASKLHWDKIEEYRKFFDEQWKVLSNIKKEIDHA